jgi:hypothetical protein
MKRMIVCTECWPKYARYEKEFPDEHFKIVHGAALRSFACDDCNKRIFGGHTCAAISMWNDELASRGRGYEKWEHGYIREPKLFKKWVNYET